MSHRMWYVHHRPHAYTCTQTWDHCPALKLWAFAWTTGPESAAWFFPLLLLLSPQFTFIYQLPLFIILFLFLALLCFLSCTSISTFQHTLMEMEDHHHHQEPQYGINDLRQLVSGPRPTHFPSIPPPPPTAELFPAGHPNLMTATTHHHQQQHYEISMMFGRQVAEIMPRCLHDFASTDSAAAATTPTTTTSASTPPLSGLEAETAGCIGGGDASTGRWPRQETLTLLDIRSRLDPKFKEANQKGPLWDEVSRYKILFYFFNSTCFCFHLSCFL